MPLGEIARDVYNSLPPGTVPFIAQTLVSAFITAFFSYKSDKKIVFETAKATYLCGQVEELRKEGMVSETEFLVVSRVMRKIDYGSGRNLLQGAA